MPINRQTIVKKPPASLDTSGEGGHLGQGKIRRARCRSICGEMHSGFSALRSALPMNLRAHCPGFKVWERAQNDIDRITTIWRDWLAAYGGPYLFGTLGMADASDAPDGARFFH